MSIRRSAKRYLRGAERTTRDLQEMLNANPALAAAGGLLLNAVMQSKYGPTLQRLMTPVTPVEAQAADRPMAREATPAEPA